MGSMRSITLQYRNPSFASSKYVSSIGADRYDSRVLHVRIGHHLTTTLMTGGLVENL